MKWNAFSMVLFAVFAMSCSKDDSGKSKMELITQKTWVHKGFMTDVNNNQTPDDKFYNVKDMSLKFNSDGTLDFKQDTINAQLHWQFENNESCIKVIGIMDYQSIPAMEESILTLFRLNESSLIFYTTSSANAPENWTFNVFERI